MTQDTNLTMIIGQAITGKTVETGAKDAARAVHEAGYRRPRVIATVEELEALPVWSTISADTVSMICVGRHPHWAENMNVWTNGYGTWIDSKNVNLPAIVLWEPSQ